MTNKKKTREEIIQSYQDDYEELVKENEKVPSITPNGRVPAEAMDVIDREISNQPIENFLERQLDNELERLGYESLSKQEEESFGEYSADDLWNDTSAAIDGAFEAVANFFSDLFGGSKPEKPESELGQRDDNGRLSEQDDPNQVEGEAGPPPESITQGQRAALGGYGGDGGDGGGGNDSHYVSSFSKFSGPPAPRGTPGSTHPGDFNGPGLDIPISEASAPVASPTSSPVASPVSVSAASPASSPTAYNFWNISRSSGGGGGNSLTNTRGDPAGAHNGGNKNENSYADGTGCGPPIVLDLDGDGVHLTQMAQNNTLFDMDADGYREMMGWHANPEHVSARDDAFA